MKCDKEKLILYLYRELKGKEKKEFMKHLKECPSCQKDLQDFAKILRLYRKKRLPKITKYILIGAGCAGILFSLLKFYHPGKNKDIDAKITFIEYEIEDLVKEFKKEGLWQE